MPFNHDALVAENAQLREPQRGAWRAIAEHFGREDAAREVGIVLPVGCGKSGLIAITPYAVRARRVLVIAPGLRIKEQLAADLRSSSPTNFYDRFGILGGDAPYPEVAVVEGSQTNLDDLVNADVVVSNIQQLQGEENRWLATLPADFFDLILVDEAHHNAAESWQRVQERFPRAKVVNYSATPRRADGQVMSGDVIYTYSVVEAINAGFVKRLRAKMLNPAELTYIDPSDGVERTITAAEVRRLGGEDAAFRRGIVMSPETLSSIVQCSIAELRRLRTSTGDNRLKIIASALSQRHCIQIVQAFNAYGLRADYVHSLESGQKNRAVFEALERDELDVIVQARMLGEGFDHPRLAVAMVGSIFSNLSPFVQFVGRVMRSIRSGEPNNPLNQGVVVFHAGTNAAERWDDFREFSTADQEYFRELLPLEDAVDFSSGEVEREPGTGGVTPVEVVAEARVLVQDIALIDDPEVQALFDTLAQRGVTAEQAAEELRRRRPQRQDLRRATRTALHDLVSNEIGAVMNRVGINARARSLDPSRRLANMEFLLGELNRRVASAVGLTTGDGRSEWSLDQLQAAQDALPRVAAELEAELTNGRS